MSARATALADQFSGRALEAERSEQLSVAKLAELRARKAFTVRLCTDAVDRLFASSGGGVLQETNPVQRLWRDVHAIRLTPR